MAEIETSLGGGAPTNRPDLYLTFDDGPLPATGKVLDVLKEHSVVATFFVVLQRAGERSAQYKLLSRMVQEGHAVGNHGVDHKPMRKDQYVASTIDAVKKDFDDNVSVLRKIFESHQQTPPKMMVARLPGDGRTFPKFVKMITDVERVAHVGWDLEFAPEGIMKFVTFHDWQGIRGVKATRKECPNARDIVLLHEAHWSGAKLERLSKLVAKLKAAYRLKSMRDVPVGLTTIKYPP